MFKKMVEAFSKLTVKQLLALGATFIILAMFLIWGVAANASNVFAEVAAILIAILLVIVAAISLASMAVTLESNKTEAKQKQVLETLKGQLSYDEFTEVNFEPINSNSRNIQRCLEIFDDFKVTHFAKINDDGNIIVIAKDANGESSRPNTMTPQFFDANYKILK